MAVLVQRADSGVPKRVVAPDHGISREAVYEYLRHAGLDEALPARDCHSWSELRLLDGISTIGVPKLACIGAGFSADWHPQPRPRPTLQRPGEPPS